MAVNKKRQLFSLIALKWRIILATSLTLATGLVSLSIFHQLKINSHTQSFAITTVSKSKPIPVKVAVTALGRLQPQDKITYLSAPNSINGVRVEKLLVKEGDNVKKGQVLAYVENYARSQAAIQQAFDKLLIARTKLAQVQAGAKTGDINAQKATITRLNSQLKGVYYIVAGSFSKIENANKLKLELENKGFRPEIISRSNNMFSVTYYNFTSEINEKNIRIFYLQYTKQI